MKKMLSFAAAVVMALSLTACDALGFLSSDSSGSSESGSSNISGSAPSGTNPGTSSAGGNSSDPDMISTTPLTVKCGDMITENGKRTFDAETTCGNAFVVIYHYIASDSWRIENAIPSFRPLAMTDIKDILNDPQVGGSSLSESDFELVNGIYRMKDEEKAKALLGSLANTYSFDQYWKNLKMAEIVSTEGISAEEAKPIVDEMFENMSKNV